ncbi:MAG: S8 family serine peptidase [Actinomycetota bacterium]
MAKGTLRRRLATLIAAVVASTLSVPAADAATNWCGLFGSPSLSQIADVPTPGTAYAQWDVHVPAGETAGFWLLDMEANARHAFAVFIRQGAGPWTLNNGFAATAGPLMLTKVYARTGDEGKEVAVFTDSYENGEGKKMLAVDRDRDLSVLMILAATMPQGGGHSIACGSEGVSVTSVSTGPAMRASPSDFRGGTVAGIDSPFGATVADGVSYSTDVAGSLFGFYWDRSTFDATDTFTSPSGTQPAKTPSDARVFLGAPAGTYSWTLNKHVGTNEDFLFLGADVNLSSPEPPEPTPSPTPTGSPTPSPVPTEPPPPGGRGTYPPTPNDPYFGPGEDIDPLGATRFGMQWGPQQIEANEAWQEDRATGSGVKVAVLDSGVDLGHPDLACPGKLDVVSGSDVVAGDSVPDDENGHGTHVAGIIGACTNNGVGIAGVAPDATIIPIRLLNAAGEGTDDQLIAGIERSTEAGAHVINLSLGYPPGKEIINDVSSIDAALEAAAAEGVVIVAAAGNDSLPLCEYPALAEDVICVGATDSRDNKSWYSTFANKTTRGGPALVAPGGTGTVFCDLDSEEILSLYARTIDQAEGNCDTRPGYTDLNGTSMATPHVAGAAALVYDRVGGQRSPENAQQVIDTLTSTTVDLGVPGPDPVYGSGRVDALAAVCAVGPDCDAVNPSPTPTESGSPSPSPSESPQPDLAEVAFTETSAASGQYSDKTFFEARLTDSNGDPLQGRELTFELVGAESSRSFSATTNEGGVARVTPTLTEKPGPHQLTVRYAGDDDHAGDADTVSFVVDKEDSALALTETKGKDKALVAHLYDGDALAGGIAGRTIDFYAGAELIGTATTDDDGVATFQPPKEKGKKQTYEARFKGDEFYLESSDTEGKGGNGGGSGGGNAGRDASASYGVKVLLI